MILCYVAHNMTTVIYFFIIQEIREKEKRQKKIKSNKIK